MAERRAIDIAHDLFRRPLMARMVQGSPLPPGMIEVIRIAAGEVPAREGRLLPDSQTAETTRQAAVFFLQQALFQSQGDDYRVLGLTPPVTSEQIREHKRWLLKWLHPDRNASKWESQLFLRVARAAEELEKRGDAPAPAANSAMPPDAAAGGQAKRLFEPTHRSRRAPAPGRGAPLLRQTRPSVVLDRPERPAGRGVGRRSARRAAMAAGAVLLAVTAWHYGEGTALRVALERLVSEPLNWLALAKG